VNTTTSKLQPALIGGLVTGVLSALPFVNILNACCCLWVVTGGVVAAYLLQERDANPIQVGDGAVVGLLAGVIGAFVNLVLSIPVTLLLAPMQRAMVERFIESGNFPPEVREMMASGLGTAAGIVFGFIFALFAGVIFSTLGGVLGAVIFRKKPAAPPVIDIPPSQM
jgi:uncharacterized protein YqgC (DUF456 family)